MSALKLNKRQPNVIFDDIKVESLKESDLDQVRTLFLSWSYRDFQLKRLRIPKQKMAELLVSGLWQENLRSLCVKSGDRLIGLLSVKQLPWISTMMNARSASSIHLIATEQEERVYPALLEAFSSEYQDIDFMDCRTANGDTHASQALEDSGFRFVCSEMFLARNLNGFSVDGKNLHGFIKCPHELWPQVISLAKEVHVTNRYMNDPQIPPELAQNIFSRHIAEFGCSRDSSTIIKIEKGRVLGFITYKRNVRLSQAIGSNYASLDFIGVHPEIRDNNIGYLLNMAALTDLAQEGFDHVVVRTNGNNYPALRILYQCGFKITASDLHFHLWRSHSPTPLSG